MADGRKESEKGNPFAICRAMGRRLGWSDEKIEGCIQDIKKETGFDMLEKGAAPVFLSEAGRTIDFFELYDEWISPEGDGSVVFADETFFDAVDPDFLAFMGAPFSVYGGKRYLAGKIAPLIPPHRRYVEPFAGAAAVMFAKSPSSEEILVDVDPEKVNALTLLRNHDEKTRERLLKMNWQGSRELFTRLRESKPTDPVDRFYRYMYTRWNSFGSRGDSWAVHSSTGTHQRYIEKKMPRYKKRLEKVRVFLGDWKDGIRRFDSEETFFYIDPPYIGTSNKRADHFKEPSARELAEVASKIRGKWLMSNHDVPELREAFRSFSQRTVNVPTTVDQMHSTAKRTRPELLIGNFEFPAPRVMAAVEAFKAVDDLIGA